MISGAAVQDEGWRLCRAEGSLSDRATAEPDRHHDECHGAGLRHSLAESDHGEDGDVPVPVLGLANMRTAKRAAGRLKDLADLEELG